MLEKVISGGQTGVDRAGLDAAGEAGIPVGGFCPKGRLAEDGTVPEGYPLDELDYGGYEARTEKNVLVSDGTLVLNIGKLTEGTKVTVDYARKHGRPCLVLQLDEKLQWEETLSWLGRHDIRVLNVAGPRESKRPGIYRQAHTYLRQLFRLGTV